MNRAFSSLALGLLGLLPLVNCACITVFTQFGPGPRLNNGNVAFWGGGGELTEGIYAELGSSLHKVADQNTPIPGGSGNFQQFSGSSGSCVLRFEGKRTC